MHNSRKRLAILVCTIFAAGGCADAANLTAPPRTVAESPSFNGGGWFGTGNRTDSTTIAPTGTSQVEPKEGITDGGGWFGTGN
jgi:hypothetical protein